MFETILWWHWILLGVMLLALAKVMPRFNFLWFGMGSVFTGVLLGVFSGMPPAAQYLAFALSSISFAVLWIKVIKPRM